MSEKVALSPNQPEQPVVSNEPKEGEVLGQKVEVTNEKVKNILEDLEMMRGFISNHMQTIRVTSNIISMIEDYLNSDNKDNVSKNDRVILKDTIFDLNKERAKSKAFMNCLDYRVEQQQKLVPKN